MAVTFPSVDLSTQFCPPQMQLITNLSSFTDNLSLKRKRKCGEMKITAVKFPGVGKILIPGTNNVGKCPTNAQRVWTLRGVWTPRGVWAVRGVTDV